MKRSLILFGALLLAALAPLVPARAQSGGDPLPIDFVYDALSPYGDWIYTPNYGYVWQPLASQQPGWSPYADGSWAFTDAGWTWISNEDFGWLTYHYGRWIRLMQGWMWVPGNEWAPAWVSWRQTQGQIGWAPLPPEAAWSPNVGFGGWTDGYYDIGPAYYNFVPIGMFASRTSLRPFILDRSRNFTFYDQSVNVTHTSYQQNVMNHIFVGGPDPQRIDGLGSNHVRRLTLRHDEEGFRRNWQDRQGGGPPHGAGSHSRIEQGQLFVAAPKFRREASHSLPSRVREPLQQPEVDRGWKGGADEQNAKRMRDHQRDELTRTRPPNLPEKRVLPATSMTPPPAFGRVLNPDERRGRGGNAPGATTPPNSDPRKGADDERRPMTPKNPLPPGGPPGVPPRDKDAPAPGGTLPRGMQPRPERTDSDRTPGQRPGMPQDARTDPRPGQPQGQPPGKMEDKTQGKPTDKPQDTPQGKPPAQGQDKPQGRPQGMPPGQRQDRPQGRPQGRRPGENSDAAPGGGGAPGRPFTPPTPQKPRPTVPASPPAAIPQSSPPAASMRPRPTERPQVQPPGNSRPPQQRPSAPPQRPPAAPAAPPRAAPAPAPMPTPQQPPPVRTLPPQGGRPPQLQPQTPSPQSPAPPRPGGGRGKRPQ